MKISQITRLTGLLLVAGFFYSCSSTQANLDELISGHQYGRALNALDAQIQDEPSNPDLYIQRAEVSALLAQESEPEQRGNLYSNTTSDFNTAMEAGATEAQVATIDSLRQQFWKEEHNAGLRAAENEAVANQHSLANVHFSNAIILRPDAVSSYQNLAKSQFNNGDIEEAIATLTDALNYVDTPPSSFYENLGYLYLEKGDPEEASYYYELANKDIEKDINLSFGLINAYVAADNSEKAIELLEPLVEENPDNANLRNVYGTQLYNVTENVFQDLKAAYGEEDAEMIKQLRFEAESMGDKAETQLIEAFKRDTLNTEYIQSLAVFYNNLSGQYFSLVNISPESDKKSYNDRALTLVDFAINYYSKLLDIDPDNEEYNAKLNALRNLKQNRSAGNN